MWVTSKPVAFTTKPCKPTKLREHLLFAKGLRIILLQIYEGCSVYDNPQVLDVKWLVPSTLTITHLFH